MRYEWPVREAAEAKEGKEGEEGTEGTTGTAGLQVVYRDAMEKVRCVYYIKWFIRWFYLVYLGGVECLYIESLSHNPSHTQIYAFPINLFM